MKKSAVALAAFLLSTGGALAADPIYPMQPVVPEMPVAFDWTGFYVGGHAGYAWADTDWTLIDNAGPGACGLCGSVVTSFDANGFAGGLQLGYNHQASNGFVIGAEAEFSFLTGDGEGTWLAGGATPGLRNAEIDYDWLLTVGPRVGFASDMMLFYVEGGLAFVGADYSHANLVSGNVFSDDETQTGWFVGGGMEYALDQNWSVKLEYNYADFGEDQVSLAGLRGGGIPAVAVFDVDQSMHIVKAGVNYRF